MSQTTPAPAQSRIFDMLVPLFRRLESDNPANGLSLMAVGRKADSTADSGELPEAMPS